MSLLSVQRQGSGRLLVWLHGFTQTRDSAHLFRSILAGSHELVTLDLPGHGLSSSLSATLEQTADLIAEALKEDKFDLAGYSLGARTALHLALRHPHRVSRLALIGASRGLGDEAAQLARRQSDNELANHIERVGTSTFLQEWLARPMFERLPNDPLELANRSMSSALGLANSLRQAGTGTQRWLGDQLPELTMPVLAMAGALDTKFVLEANAIAHAVVDGHVELVPDAGHAAHLEQPQAAAELIEVFLAH